MKETKFDTKITGDISKEIVYHLQKKKGKTIQEIAQMAGVSKSSVYRIKRGKTKFTIDQFLRINTKMKGDIISAPDGASRKKRELYSTFQAILKCSVASFDARIKKER